jgi:hypothetical protein
MTTRIISFSEVLKYQTCQRQYYYRFTLGLSPEEESDAITTGVNGHKLLQNFYELLRQGKTKMEALKIVADIAMKGLGDAKFADGSLLKAWTLVDNYVRETDFTSEAELIENRFLVPLAKLLPSVFPQDEELLDVQIGFTPDLVLRRKGGLLDIEDAKFVQRAWPKKKLNRFPQIKLYQIFMEAMEYEISRSIVRMFNTTTGKIEAHVYSMTPIEKEILLRDFVHAIRETLEFRKRPFEIQNHAARTMNYTACTFCHFEFPCTLEAQGKDATKTLETQYVKSSYDYTC